MIGPESRVVVVFGCSLNACMIGTQQFISDFPSEKEQTLSMNLVIPGGGAAPQIFAEDAPYLEAGMLIDAIVLVGHDGCDQGNKANLQANIALVQDKFPNATVTWYWLEVITVDPRELPPTMWQDWRWN